MDVPYPTSASRRPDVPFLPLSENRLAGSSPRRCRRCSAIVVLLRSWCWLASVDAVLLDAQPGTSSRTGPACVRSDRRRRGVGVCRQRLLPVSIATVMALPFCATRRRGGRRSRVRRRRGSATRSASGSTSLRIPVDRDRHLRLHVRGAGPHADRRSRTPPERYAPVSRSRSSCCCRCSSDDRGPGLVSEPSSRGELRARRLEVADGDPRRSADRSAASSPARRWRSPARPVRPRLFSSPAPSRVRRSTGTRRTRCVDSADDLPVLGVGRSEPARAGLGGGVRPDHVRARDELVARILLERSRRKLGSHASVAAFTTPSPGRHTASQPTHAVRAAGSLARDHQHPQGQRRELMKRGLALIASFGRRSSRSAGTAREHARRLRALAARSSRRSSPPGRRRSVRRSDTRCSTARSGPVPVSRRSRTAGRLRCVRRTAHA